MNALQLHELEDIETMDEEQREEQRERFRITDTASLNWAFRKLIAIEAKKTDINEMVDHEISRLEHFRTHEIGKLEKNEKFFHSLIEEYAEKKRAQNPKYSEVTPYGGIYYRKQPLKWNYDEEALIQHLEANDLTEFVRVKKELNKAEIKKQFKVDKGKVYDVTGQEVAGISVEKQPDKLIVKASEF